MRLLILCTIFLFCNTIDCADSGEFLNRNHLL